MTIEGSSPDGDVQQVVVVASGSYELENLDTATATVTLRPANFQEDERSRIAQQESTLGTGNGSGQATFANVSGDITSMKVMTGWNEEEFIAWNDGETQEKTVATEVEVEVGDDNGTCADFAETHDVTVVVHNEPDDNGGASPPDGGDDEGPPNVSASSTIDGHITFYPSDGRVTVAGESNVWPIHCTEPGVAHYRYSLA